MSVVRPVTQRENGPSAARAAACGTSPSTDCPRLVAAQSGDRWRGATAKVTRRSGRTRSARSAAGRSRRRAGALDRPQAQQRDRRSWQSDNRQHPPKGVESHPIPMMEPIGRIGPIFSRRQRARPREVGVAADHGRGLAERGVGVLQSVPGEHADDRLGRPPSPRRQGGRERSAPRPRRPRPARRRPPRVRPAAGRRRGSGHR